MKIRDMFERGTVFSFEIFPPKKTAPIETILIRLRSWET